MLDGIMTAMHGLIIPLVVLYAVLTVKASPNSSEIYDLFSTAYGDFSSSSNGVLSDNAKQGTVANIRANDIKDAFDNAKKYMTKYKRMEQIVLAKGSPLINGSAPELYQASTKANRNSLMIMDNYVRYLELMTYYLAYKLRLPTEEIVLKLPQVDLDAFVKDIAEGGKFSFAKGKDGTPKDVEDLVKGCQQMTRVLCAADCKYRTYNGTCNNVQRPRWGSARTCVDRILPPIYDDGISTIRNTSESGILPNARRLTNFIHRQINKEDVDRSHLLAVFGEFLHQDISSIPTISIVTPDDQKSLQCCSKDFVKHIECASINATGDYFYSIYEQNCIGLVRSVSCTTCNLGPRQPLTESTSFIDGSHIYGNSEEDNALLRTLTDGQLRQSPGGLLPITTQCKSQGVSNCFLTGDYRVNDNLGSVSMYTLWMREHNRIAAKIQASGLNSSDEEIFQEARRIVIAKLQAIVFNEYLPLILGPKWMEKFQLSTNDYDTYIPSLNPSVTDAFTAAAMRFTHSAIQNTVRLRSDFRDDEVSLHLLYGHNATAFGEPYLAAAIAGLAFQPQQSVDEYFGDGVSNYLFRSPFDMYGIDLPAANIVRGRELGLQSYNSWRRYCLNRGFSSFRDLASVMTPERIQRLQKIYNHVDDIDLYTGGLMETHEPGARVGPTFACILANQFRRLKFGDRYFFGFTNQVGSFTNDQIAALKKVTLRDIICDNTNITEIQDKVFLQVSEGNPLKRCTSNSNITPFYSRNLQSNKVAEVSCDGVSRFPETFFVSPVSSTGVPTDETCSIRVIFGVPRVCKIRINVVELELPGTPPDECYQQQFIAVVPSTGMPLMDPRCGDMKKQTIELVGDFPEKEVMFSLTTRNLRPLPEKWRIRITLLQCKDKGPQSNNNPKNGGKKQRHYRLGYFNSTNDVTEDGSSTIV